MFPRAAAWGGNKTASSKLAPRHRNQTPGETDMSIGPELSSKLPEPPPVETSEDNFHYLATFPRETKGNWNPITPRKGRESAVPRLRGKLPAGRRRVEVNGVGVGKWKIGRTTVSGIFIEFSRRAA